MGGRESERELCCVVEVRANLLWPPQYSRLAELLGREVAAAASSSSSPMAGVGGGGGRRRGDPVLPLACRQYCSSSYYLWYRPAALH